MPVRQAGYYWLRFIGMHDHRVPFVGEWIAGNYGSEASDRWEVTGSDEGIDTARVEVLAGPLTPPEVG